MHLHGLPLEPRVYRHHLLDLLQLGVHHAKAAVEATEEGAPVLGLALGLGLGLGFRLGLALAFGFGFGLAHHRRVSESPAEEGHLVAQELHRHLVGVKVRGGVRVRVRARATVRVSVSVRVRVRSATVTMSDCRFLAALSWMSAWLGLRLGQG